MISQKVIDVLNNDAKARALLGEFRQVANRKGLTGEEYRKVYETFMMMLISNNTEAMSLMANEMYMDLNR
ncbi:hypothetical protein [Paenibacillus cremeus]|uniref:Uncharacterized protein n=1 Tax=Paenibacillus cremeus TaxID=2163881 RepID=A0A559KCR7_9BACL|nr:hypothetical protein [Paenibacillus cremeus]TVY09914.1 hypothetical protein FPZ49_11120 [Paenibacillus cremeus]